VHHERDQARHAAQLRDAERLDWHYEDERDSERVSWRAVPTAAPIERISLEDHARRIAAGMAALPALESAAAQACALLSAYSQLSPPADAVVIAATVSGGADRPGYTGYLAPLVRPDGAPGWHWVRDRHDATRLTRTEATQLCAVWIFREGTISEDTTP
jgi:hypothetical protein